MIKVIKFGEIWLNRFSAIEGAMDQFPHRSFKSAHITTSLQNMKVDVMIYRINENNYCETAFCDDSYVIIRITSVNKMFPVIFSPVKTYSQYVGFHTKSMWSNFSKDILGECFIDFYDFRPCKTWCR